MYIKLTRTDGTPIWLNAAFVVTIEPQKRGTGSTVVPIGDGLDYDVRESPEAVLALLDGAPVPAVVPVPSTDALTLAPEDVSPEDETAAPQEPAPAAGQDKKTSARRTKTKTAKSAPADAEPQAGEETEKKKPAARSRGRKKVLPVIDEAGVERLRKLAPKSLKKLKNTISSQFNIEDTDGAVEALGIAGVFTLDGERVVWPGSADNA